MSSSSASESRVQKISVLEGLPRRDEAMALLQRLAKDCAPIMTRRGWTVSHLKEFYPKDDGLLGLNVNRGATISVRLRPPGEQNSFYSYEEHIVGTMVHELAHIQESNHSAAFYRLLDELMDNVSSDIGKSSSGFFLSSSNSSSISTFLPFTGTGMRLGGASSSSNSSKSASLPGMRDRMANAALRRNPGASKTSLPSTKETLREKAAEAALRRIRDNQWCSGKSHDENEDGILICSEISNPSFRQKSDSKKPITIDKSFAVSSIMNRCHGDGDAVISLLSDSDDEQAVEQTLSSSKRFSSKASRAKPLKSVKVNNTISVNQLDSKSDAKSLLIILDGESDSSPPDKKKLKKSSL